MSTDGADVVFVRAAARRFVGEVVIVGVEADVGLAQIVLDA
ncbi:hypothetical protein ACIPX0_07845 [Streptomyces sp. NPDC090075]